MIVCHCNVITRNDIMEAARDLLDADRGSILTPQSVYRALDKRGRCCGCYPAVAALLRSLMAELEPELELLRAA